MMIDKIQNYIVEIVGTIVFLVASGALLDSYYNFVPRMDGSAGAAAIGIVLGLAMMGYKGIVRAIGNVFEWKQS